ncbi:MULTISPECIES: nitroreductase family protein [unclassified Duganella]|uniref:nitroreductase family protein n=1 Tax=unclassified Duganella TaxID=2636909 RepID=UPI00087FF292|nr:MULTISPECIES: nitroreductase family protein [unclassified Duganella]SDH36135.1 Nitroreductase [Duganella sp. OV458]SDK52523.1 Nitroreductase [Duganella sp. OV510]
MRGLIAALRRLLKACPRCHARYTRAKYFVLSLARLRYGATDLRQVWRHMYWQREPQMAAGPLQAKLLFYYHKIEKGLCMPGPRRLFGLEVLPQVMRLLEAWEQGGHERDDPIYLGALSSLSAYRARLLEHGLDREQRILPQIDAFLRTRPAAASAPSTPVVTLAAPPAVSYAQLLALSEARRSYRDFAPTPVPEQLLQQAVQLAQLSPSACNRQPCRLYAISDAQRKQQLLSHQNGNLGFGHLAPVVLVITADMRYFFDASERHQPYIDGGLFSMSLLYALQVQGLVSCCLNWCVTPATDHAAHQLLGLPDAERIVMLMVAGYPPPASLVPRSHRKRLSHVLVAR